MIKRLYRRRLMGAGGGEPPVPVRPLPAGYTRYDWIKCSAYQDGAYINTGIPNQVGGIKFEAEVYCEDILFDGSHLFGARGEWVHDISVGGWYEFNWFPDRDDYFKSTNTRADIVNRRNIIIADDNGISVNGGGCTTVWDANAEPHGTLCLLAGMLNNWYMPLYWAKITVNGVLTRDYVACTDPSNVPGVYDYVTEAFSGNAGTGYFIVGNG